MDVVYSKVHEIPNASTAQPKNDAVQGSHFCSSMINTTNETIASEANIVATGKSVMIEKIITASINTFAVIETGCVK